MDEAELNWEFGLSIHLEQGYHLSPAIYLLYIKHVYYIGTTF